MHLHNIYYVFSPRGATWRSLDQGHNGGSAHINPTGFEFTLVLTTQTLQIINHTAKL